MILLTVGDRLSSCITLCYHVDRISGVGILGSRPTNCRAYFLKSLMGNLDGRLPLLMPIYTSSWIVERVFGSVKLGISNSTFSCTTHTIGTCRWLHCDKKWWISKKTISLGTHFYDNKKLYQRLSMLVEGDFVIY